MQRQYHENIQQIIGRQKHEFDDFLLQNGLKLLKKTSDKPLTNENVEYFPTRVVASTLTDNFKDVCDDNDNEFFSSLGELKSDENDSDNAMQQVKNDDSDGEQYFSLK